MSFTKIAAAGIGSTETVTLHSLEVLNNATVGGVLTYEDVTNVDSIGIITARAGVLVGSGITLSKDGDIFATGVTTSTTFVGSLTGTASLASNLTGTPNISCGTIAGSTGTFSGAVSGTTGTFSGVIKIPDGSTSAPSIAASSDTNSGLYFAGADAVGLVAGGSRKLLANSSGITINNGDLTIDDKIIHSGDTDTAIRFSAADTIQLETGGAARLTFSGGNIIQQSGTLYIKNATGDSNGLKISQESSDESRIFNHYSGALTFGTNNTERARIASDGKLSVDRTHASATTGNHPALDIDTIAAGTAGASFATGIDFRVAGVHKKRLVVTNADSSAGTGDWIFYRDNGSNVGLQISSAGYITAPSQPYLQVGISGNISVSANNSYEIIFNQENYDTANAYNTSNGRYVVPVTGDYLCTLDVQYTAEVNGFHLGVALNNGNPGTNFDIWNHTGDGVRGDNIARVLRVTANGSNYISFYTYTTSGGTLEVNRTKATIKFLG